MKDLSKIIQRLTVLIIDIQKDKKKTLLFILACIIILYIDFFIIIKFQFCSSRELRTKIIKLKTSITNLTKDLASMQNQQEKRSKAEEDVSSKNKEFISQGQISFLMEEISDIAVKNKVKIMQIKPSKEQLLIKEEKNALTEKFTPLYITLDLISGYHNLGSFIGDMENGKTFISVQNMRILPNKDDYLLENISLVLKTYVKK